MFEIIYFSPHFRYNVHEEIVRLLNKINLLYGIKWSEKVVTKYPFYSHVKHVDMSEKEAYDMYLKPASRRIKKCLEILFKKGIDVNVENVSRKFRSRSGNYYIAGSIAILRNGRVFCALSDSGEILSFLRTLLKEGPGLLNELAISVINKSHGELSESSIVREYSRKLVERGYTVFLNVKHNILAKNEKITYLFSPDADIIAVRGSEIIGIEVKGKRTSGSTLGLEQVYTGLGEALLYLINPVIFEYDDKTYEGGIFDKVYLLIPELPPCCESSLIKLIRNLNFVGLITLSNGIEIEPIQNPYLNLQKKYLFLANIKSLIRYIS